MRLERIMLFSRKKPGTTCFHQKLLTTPGVSPTTRGPGATRYRGKTHPMTQQLPPLFNTYHTHAHTAVSKRFLPIAVMF